MTDAASTTTTEEPESYLALAQKLRRVATVTTNFAEQAKTVIDAGVSDEVAIDAADKMHYLQEAGVVSLVDKLKAQLELMEKLQERRLREAGN